MYNLLSKRYLLTKSRRIILIKHKYDKREYMINPLKKNKNVILEDNKSYKSIANDLLKSDIDCYTKYTNNFCSNRLNTKKKKAIYCFQPTCFNKVIDGNYCSDHQDKKYDF